ncbi:RNA polymerase sigma factor [Pedobacter sp. L105]|uniref:RNA polymerase sigma factor n=1 Tax=Pedobacter sp. L105 TaxID=1641871 RepID=UPI00131C2832|nr:RNA polymerase sigma-70 factor [Pedobacter sp. L105]
MSIYSKLSDNELASLIREGNEASFAEVYERFYGILYLHAHKRLNNEEEARDVIHELFAALWSKHESLEIANNLSGYLYSAIRNRILDIISHKKVEEKYIDSLQHYIDHDFTYADHLVRERDLARLIEKEIASLPPKMREVFVLSRKSHLSHKEIAELLGISEQTVRTQIKKALRILRLKLGFWIYLLILLKFR